MASEITAAYILLILHYSNSQFSLSTVYRGFSGYIWPSPSIKDKFSMAPAHRSSGAGCEECATWTPGLKRLKVKRR